MSFQSIAWAVRQKLPCTQKIVLLMLADRHNSDTGRCDPSHERLSVDCGLSRRSVIDQIEKLVNAGFVSIAHRAIDGFKTSNQYRLNLEFNVPTDVNVVHNDVQDVHYGCERGAHIDVKLVQKGSAPAAHKPVIKPVIKPVSKTAPDLPPDLLADFLVVRKAKKSGALTNTALRGIEREATNAGLTLEQAVTACCEFGWAGFNAGWYADRMAKKQATGETAYQRSMRERVAEFSPSIAKQAPGTYPIESMTLEATNVVAIASH